MWGVEDSPGEDLIEMDKFMLARIFVFIVGLIIVGFVMLTLVPSWLPYSDEIPFWYFTSNSSTNVGFAIAIAWSVCALILWPLTAPKTLEEAGLAFIGYSFIAIGFGFVAPTRFSFMGVRGMSPELGYVLMIFGGMALVYSYVRWNKKMESTTDEQPKTEKVVLSSAHTKCDNCSASYVYSKEQLNPDGSVNCQNCGSKIEHPNV